MQTYTVEYNRDNTPLRGHVVGRLKSSGHRFLANHGDEASLHGLASTKEEPIGKAIVVKKDSTMPGRNLFFFKTTARL